MGEVRNNISSYNDYKDDGYDTALISLGAAMHEYKAALSFRLLYKLFYIGLLSNATV